MQEYKVQVYNGRTEWRQNCQLNRLDGPAIEDSGNKYWLKNGSYHRVDGPAMECADGKRFWFIDGKELTEAEFNSSSHDKKPCSGKKVTIDGIDYELM